MEDNLCGDKVCGDKVFVDKVCVDKVCGDKVFVEKMYVDKVYVDKVCVDKVCGDKVCVDKVCGDKVYVDKACVDKVFVDKVFVDKVFVDKVFVDKVFVDKVCVDKVWRRAEEEKAEEEEPGIQNQKQEPHTKMWGKKVQKERMHPHVRAEIPSLGSTAWVHVNPIDGYQCSNELRAQLNLTNDHKRKKYHTCKACPVAWSWKKGEARHSGTLFNTATSTGETWKKGRQFHFT